MSEITKIIQLVIPMAGLGSRFSEAGYGFPKPLLPIHGVPMYKVVLANLMHEAILNVTIICPKDWGLGDEMRGLQTHLGVPVNVVEIDYTTAGPAKTVALAEPFLDPALPVVTANSDQYLDANLGKFYELVCSPQSTGVILCMQDSDPKWSYVRLSSTGYVIEVKEKQVISNLATVGVYGFATGALMSYALNAMFDKCDMAFGEYYVAPSFKYLIDLNLSVHALDIGPVGKIMYGLGIPSDYEKFLLSPASLRAVRGPWLQS